MPRPLVFSDKEFADAAVELPTANHFVGIPFFQDAIDDFFDVIEIGFWFKRIVDAVVASEKKRVVVHFGRDRSGNERGQWLRRGREP